MKTNTPLWRRKAVYQVYPRSFKDSNGDGIGDINGIISKLPYLADLGIGIIWLSPCYKSPKMDLGYDISDYLSIDPDYGTMDDFDNLVKEADRLGIKVVMDLVVNHTSDEHPWFVESKKKDSLYRDYYIWRDGKGDNPPNNWTSQFSGPAWDYDPDTKQWYLHLYSKKQPDLNWHNPKVLEEVEKILRFYLDKGVYGFRCDVINQIYKESLEDGKGHAQNGRGVEHYLMKDGNHRILRTLYEDVFSHYDCVVIGETYNVDVPNGIRFLENHELDMFFQFDHVNVDRHPSQIFALPFSAKKFKGILYKWQTSVSWNANYMENHDQPRSVERFGDKGKLYDLSAKALAMLNFTLRGTPFIFEGQEIGMRVYPGFDARKSKDVSCLSIYDIAHKSFHLPNFIAQKIAGLHNRDDSRLPLSWDSGDNAGFSTCRDTWLPVHPNHKDGYNVEDQSKDPESILNFYKKLIRIREGEMSLLEGSFEPLSTKGGLFAYRRRYQDEECLFLLNLTKRGCCLPAYLRHVNGRVLLSTYHDSDPSDMRRLRPYEAILIKLN